MSSASCALVAGTCISCQPPARGPVAITRKIHRNMRYSFSLIQLKVNLKARSSATLIERLRGQFVTGRQSPSTQWHHFEACTHHHLPPPKKSTPSLNRALINHQTIHPKYSTPTPPHQTSHAKQRNGARRRHGHGAHREVSRKLAR